MMEVAAELSRRLIHLFLCGRDSRRPAMGWQAIWQHQAHWCDLLLFYEYVHGDTGAGCGASHQTGWIGLVAQLIQHSGV